MQSPRAGAESIGLCFPRLLFRARLGTIRGVPGVHPARRKVKMFRKLAGLFSQYRGLRKEIYVLFIGRIVTGMGSMVWPMLTMILSGKLGMSAQDIAELMIAAGVLLLPANLIGGKLADRYNKKNVIVVCDFISVTSYIAAGFIPLGKLTIALIIVAAILQSMEHPSYSALFADLTATRDRQRAFSLSYLGMNLGLVLSPTIAGLLFKDHLDLIFIWEHHRGFNTTRICEHS